MIPVQSQIASKTGNLIQIAASTQKLTVNIFRLNTQWTEEINSVWHCKFESSNMMQLEHNGDIAYNAFLGQIKQSE